MKNFPFKADIIRSVQIKLLKDLLVYSYDRFEFYKKRFDEAGFNPDTFKDLDDILKIPILEKSEYREFVNSRFEKNPEIYTKYYKDGTSGTTGEPLKIYRTWNERAYMLAKYLRTLFLNGYRPRDITFGLPSPHRITGSDSILQKFGFLRRESVAYTEPVEKMVNGYINSGAELLYANRSQLIQMAEYIIKEKITVKKPGLINCSGEVLDTGSRNIIESVFGKDRLFEVYGAVEFNNLAFQIVGEKFLHFNHDTNLIELEDENGNINFHKGRSVITDFHIFSFPLIRYRLNDYIEMEKRNGLKVITKIIGREDDCVTTEDGRKISFHPFYEVMERRTAVQKFRFVQESFKVINADIVLKNGVKRKAFKEELIRDLRGEVDKDMIYNIRFVEKIPDDPGGKQRILSSKVG